MNKDLLRRVLVLMNSKHTFLALCEYGIVITSFLRVFYLLHGTCNKYKCIPKFIISVNFLLQTSCLVSLGEKKEGKSWQVSVNVDQCSFWWKVVASLDTVVGGSFVIISKSFINVVLLVEREWTL